MQLELSWVILCLSRVITGVYHGLSRVILCFTSYFVFNIADLSHSPGVVDYHLLLRQET